MAVESYRAALALPATERFGLAQQMREAAVSIPANIVEGKGRNQPRDFARFLAIARGSARELDTYFVLAQRLEYLRVEQVVTAEKLLDEVGRMLTTLMRRVAPL